MTPHKHHDLIVAWAKGATIQIEQGPGYWADCSNNQPGWCAEFKYRIKPEPKPDKVVFKYINRNGFTFSRDEVDECELPANLCLTIDGETGKLKKAEVIDEA